ncbi:MAG: M15 family metallopeptidase [Clostridia bacterium]|nr:M15 family metallopeptidase [Clostridia bacterium]
MHAGKGDEPVRFSDDASGFVLLSDAVPDAILEIRYFSTFNFIGDPIDGYDQPVALLTREAADALRAVSDDVAPMGYRLRIFDAYRPQRAVDHFMRWAEDGADTRMKAFFYPQIDKADIIPGGFVARHSGHSRGSTVDLTLFDMRDQKDLDMGGPFDYFGERSHFDSPQATPAQRQHRALLREAMARRGFCPLAEEWWHFTLRPEPYPDTYFTFPVSCRSVGK